MKKKKVLEMNLFQIISGNEEAKGCVDEVWGNCDACVCFEFEDNAKFMSFNFLN